MKCFISHRPLIHKSKSVGRLKKIKADKKNIEKLTNKLKNYLFVNFSIFLLLFQPLIIFLITTVLHQSYTITLESVWRCYYEGCFRCQSHLETSMKRIKLGNTPNMGAGNESKTFFFCFFKETGSVRWWETNHFMGMALG